MKIYSYTSFILILFFSNLNAQKTIELLNPSFKAYPRAGVLLGFGPRNWKDCSFENETSVDIQPGSFEVDLIPSDGGSYIGMIVRESDTFPINYNTAQ